MLKLKDSLAFQQLSVFSGLDILNVISKIEPEEVPQGLKVQSAKNRKRSCRLRLRDSLN